MEGGTIGRKRIIKTLNWILREKNIKKATTKKHVILHGVWDVSTINKRNLLRTEMDFDVELFVYTGNEL